MAVRFVQARAAPDGLVLGEREISMVVHPDARWQ
jgi:hypothetical protein